MYIHIDVYTRKLVYIGTQLLHQLVCMYVYMYTHQYVHTYIQTSEFM